MAPFTISVRHSLPYQGCLPQEAPFTKSKMIPELPPRKAGSNEDLPLVRYWKMSLMMLKVHLWQIFQRLANYFTKVSEIFRSKMFFFVHVGKSVAMMGAMRKSGVERLGEDEDLGLKDPEMKVWMELDDDDDDDDGRESLVIESEEEDEDRLSDWESDEDTDYEEERKEEAESDWSDDEDDSEASAESIELWESFLHNGDPYNPLSFCSSTGSRTNTSRKQLTNQQQTQTTPDTRPEETQPKPSPKEGGKKVRFSDQVTVRPLVAWRFASRAARDGSCWLQMARDRDRFRKRVAGVEAIITPCLTPEHRVAVWDRLHH